MLLPRAIVLSRAGTADLLLPQIISLPQVSTDVAETSITNILIYGGVHLIRFSHRMDLCSILQYLVHWFLDSGNFFIGSGILCFLGKQGLIINLTPSNRSLPFH